MHVIRLGMVLALLWLFLSGHYTALMLAFGGCSIAFVIYLTSRMDDVDKEAYTILINLSVLTYLSRLCIKVIASNWDVVLRITGIKPVTSRFVELPLPSDDELTNVIYANAITLTPGTASITMEKGKLLVHTMSEEGAQALLDGDMEVILPDITTGAASREDEE